jgi:hypothetical protein
LPDYALLSDYANIKVFLKILLNYSKSFSQSCRLKMENAGVITFVSRCVTVTASKKRALFTENR